MISPYFSEESEMPVTEWNFTNVVAFDESEFKEGIIMGIGENYDIDINNIGTANQVFFIPVWAPVLELLCTDYSNFKRNYNSEEYKILKFGHKNLTQKRWWKFW